MKANHNPSNRPGILRTFQLFAVAGVLLLSSRQASAALVMDGGAGLGASFSVASGTSLTVKISYVPVAAPIPFDGVGLDLNWTPTGTAAATPLVPFLLAGTSTGFALVDDLIAPVGPGFVSPGAPLANPGVPSPLGAGSFSIGGGSHFDTTGTAGPLFTSGTSYGVPSGSVPLDLMGAHFIITGAPGDTVTFTPSGILTPGVTIPGGVVTTPGGDPYMLNSFVPGFGATAFEPMMIGITVTIVPEPSMLALFFCGVMGLVIRRRR